MDAKRELEKVIEDSEIGNFVIQVCLAKGLRIGNGIKNLAQAILSKLPELVEIDKEKLYSAEMIQDILFEEFGFSYEEVSRKIAHAICQAKGILRVRK